MKKELNDTDNPCYQGFLKLLELNKDSGWINPVYQPDGSEKKKKKKKKKKIGKGIF